MLSERLAEGLKNEILLNPIDIIGLEIAIACRIIVHPCVNNADIRIIDKLRTHKNLSVIVNGHDDVRAPTVNQVQS